MTNNILGVNNINNPSGYNRKVEAAAGQAFSSVLQSKMNASTMSIADFSNLDGGGTNSKNNSVFGSGGSLYGSNMFSGLSGNSLGSGSGIGSETMLAFIMLAMAQAPCFPALPMLSRAKTITGLLLIKIPWAEHTTDCLLPVLHINPHMPLREQEVTQAVWVRLVRQVL